MTLTKIDGQWYAVSKDYKYSEPIRTVSGWKVTWADGPLADEFDGLPLERWVSAYRFTAPNYRTVTINCEERNSYYHEEPVKAPRGKEIRWQRGAWQRYSQSKGWQYA